MNYEKKYKEALERAKKFYNDEGCRVGMTPIDLEVIFPELIESEDERIRKVLIGWINLEPSTSFNDTFNVFSKEQIIAWLEKQNNADKVKQQQTIEIPFGAKDSELQEATYYILDGYHAEINGNEVIIKKGEQKTTWKPTEKQMDKPLFTYDDILALQCCMETVKKVQEDKDLYEKLKDLHGRVYDAYQLEKQEKTQQEPTSDRWQDVRERAAIAVFPQFVKTTMEILSQGGEIKMDVKELAATNVVVYADALIRKLKGE